MSREPTRRFLLGGLAGLAAGTGPACAVGTGSGRIDVPEEVGATADPVPVWFHRPAEWPPEGRVVVVMHGQPRNARDFRDEWRNLAEAGRFLLLAPEFSHAKFPGSEGYAFANAVDAAGRTLPRAGWTFFALNRVVQAAMRGAGAVRRTFSLYGHSSGGQFVHRYLLLTGAPLAETLVIANAGAYTLPRTDRLFPEGLGGLDLRPDLRDQVFRRHVVLLLGEADTDPNHPTLAREPWAMAQGSHRFARGWFFFDTMRLAAEAQGALFTWRVATVPRVGHSSARMAQYAAAHLFSPPP